MVESYSPVYMSTSSLSLHLSETLSFRVLAVVSSAAVNLGVHVSFQAIVLSGYVPRTGIAGSYGNSILSLLWNRHTVLHNGCTSLHSHQERRNVPFALHPLQHLLFTLTMAILAGVRQCLI